MSDSFETTGYDLLDEWCPMCGLSLEGGLCPGCEGTTRQVYQRVHKQRRPPSHIVGGLLGITLYMVIATTSLAGAMVVTALASLATMTYAVHCVVTRLRNQSKGE